MAERWGKAFPSSRRGVGLDLGCPQSTGSLDCEDLLTQSGLTFNPPALRSVAIAKRVQSPLPYRLATP